MRFENRQPSELRPIKLEAGFARHAEGSCLVHFGNTHVLCTASVDERVPSFLKGTGKGWVTAEYGMLPRSTGSRMSREAKQGKQTGRTHEIQRLIGRSLRASIDLTLLGERQLIIDCDVLQADGGTRTASITGGYIALYQACTTLMKQGLLFRNPMIKQVAAVSCGLVDGEGRLDLDYVEDSAAEVDANFVMTDADDIIEIQGTAESKPFTRDQFNHLYDLGLKGITELMDHQKKIISSF